MRTHRFGRKITLPATIAIKHQVRMRMAQYEVKKAEAEARAEGGQDGMGKCADRSDDRSVRDSSVVDTQYDAIGRRTA
jgi:hypothetical protein